MKKIQNKNKIRLLCKLTILCLINKLLLYVIVKNNRRF